MAHGIVSAIPGPDIKTNLIVNNILQFFFVPVIRQKISFWLQCDYIYGKHCMAWLAWQERLTCLTSPHMHSVEETSWTSHFTGLHLAKNKTPIWDFYRA